MKYKVDGQIYYVKRGRVTSVFTEKQYLKIKQQRKRKRLAKSKKPKIKKVTDWELLLECCIGKGYEFFLNSVYWKKIRRLVLKRDGYKCTECGNKGTLNVHHLNYKYHFNEHNHLESLITLCEDCHKKIHFMQVDKEPV